jgi:hypothetical protein
MGIIELGNALGIHKSVASRLVKKGMPTTSAQSAQAWREIHAKPRAKRGQAGTVPKNPTTAPAPPKPQPIAAPSPDTTADPAPPARARTIPAHSDPEPDDEDGNPRQSLRRARLAEKVGYNELVQCKRNGGSIEDIRKANQIYISSRNNRHKAERDFKEWQQQEGILLFFDEARDIASRPHVAAKQMMEVMPKTLAPRLYGQPQKTIEKTLADWLDTLTGIIRKSI